MIDGSEVESAIYRKMSGRFHHVVVVVNGNKITLHGRTKTYHAKQLVQHAALEFLGGDCVVNNEIEVT